MPFRFVLFVCFVVRLTVHEYLGIGAGVDTLVVPSPAKINLFLEVRARRSDGYHEIESVMQLVELCDTVRLRRIPQGIRLAVQGANLPGGRENLAFRAAGLLLAEFGCPGGVAIELEKRIPVGGGLGGGSSNAAAVMAGLNRLYRLGRSAADLRALGARLGSDVPFFFGGGLSLATGRGEILTDLEGWIPHWVVLANPRVEVSSAWAYREISSKLTDGADQASITASIAGGCLPWPPTWAYNRLEQAVLPHHPAIRALRDLLREGGGSPVLMSGSGATVFAVTADGPGAHRLAARASATGAFAAAVRTLRSNPILRTGESALS
ncbi:MAG: 4-(cytidine 5'-diphospho)-2-C-methyl-D-erythritol kinase [candidate division NC10 bacterium]|nr:4-(cytidine 5'-diphospho)-2-C-methyl-D-erythritol kinase [candidate division NC10 bacterium]